jgi:uncharacterized protein (TIGR02001 family)
VGPSVPLRIGIPYLWIALGIAAATLAPPPAGAVTVDGDLGYASDYIVRGISQTGGRSAGQIDLRVGTQDGTFVGVFASTLERLWHHEYGATTGWDYELEAYVGHRFDLSPSWSTTLTGTSYSYLHGNAPISDDYQEITLTTSYQDLWSLELAAIPNAVRWRWEDRLGRYPAYVASTSAQIPLPGRLAFTAGAGYYTTEEDGYAFGNAGLAFEFKSLRVDLGYYVAAEHAARLFPYGRAGKRFAASVNWHF